MVRLIVLAVFFVPVLCGLSARVASAQPPVYTYEVVNRYPHAQDAFTQGLVYEGGRLYESTGLYGSSSLREVNLQTGEVLRRVDVPAQYFAEGMTLFQGKIFQLTWQHQIGFIYDPATFAKIGEFSYTGEGWGLTHDAQHLIMSDGTNRIRFLDPSTFQVVRSIEVFNQGSPLTNLNELEYINGEIYANIWQTDMIVRIDPANGAITAWIDLTGLRTSGDVLNGIAWDVATGQLLVTGKLWPWLYRINLIPPGGTSPEITSPAPGSTLTSTTQVFDWTAGTGVAQYWLYVGSSPGSADLYDQDRGLNLTATVTGLPSDGRTLYVRLWWLRGNWEFADFTYKAMTVVVTNPRITQPEPGTTLGGTSQVFQWSAGTSVSQYYVYLGSSLGGADLYARDHGLTQSASVTGLPMDGRTLYLRLWWLRSGTWEFADFTFTAASGGGNPQITSPPAGATLGTTQLFQWSAGIGVDQYFLYVGSYIGGADIGYQNCGLHRSATFTGLPADGRTLYVRLWWRRGGVWEFADVVYRAAGG